MDERLRRLEDKLEKIEDSVQSIDKTLVRQEEQLSVHMKRSEANEENNKLLREYIDQHKNESDIRIRKLESIKEKFTFMGWILASGAAVLETLKMLGIL